MAYYINIKDKQIPLIVRNYKHSNTIKMFFKGNVLNISKPKRFKTEKMMQMIQENEDELYNQYIKILSVENKSIKHWVTGEKILYSGENFNINRQNTNKKKIEIRLEPEEKTIYIKVPENVSEELIKKNIDKGIKQLLKNNTKIIIQEKLPYWSKITNISYKSFTIRDATSKFGSCKPYTKELYFSSRLVMLPNSIIDAIIVHELCHIVHKNHSDKFYELVKKYIPNYDKINKWLKKNSKEIMF